MTNRIARLIATICLSVLVLPATAGHAFAADYRLIVHESNPVTSLRPEEVKRIMLGKDTQWADGHRIHPVDQTRMSSSRKSFSKAVLHKSISAVKAYWQSQIFSGRGVPPTELKSDSAVLDFVRRNPGAIGYVSGAAKLTGVKELRVE